MLDNSPLSTINLLFHPGSPDTPALGLRVDRGGFPETQEINENVKEREKSNSQEGKDLNFPTVYFLLTSYETLNCSKCFKFRKHDNFVLKSEWFNRG